MGPRISACTKELDYWHKLFDRHVNHQILSHVDYISSGVEIISERMERMESKVEEMHETGRKGMCFVASFRLKLAVIKGFGQKQEIISRS
jgi:hypothetical protein